MNEASLILSIVAFFFGAITAGFAIWFQYRLSESSTSHLSTVQDGVSAFRTEMTALVAELRGLVDRLVEAQERQFNTMLSAFVRTPAAASEAADRASESAEEVGELAAQIESLQTRLGGTGNLSEELDAIKRQLDSVERSTFEVAALTRRASGTNDQPSRVTVVPSLKFPSTARILDYLARIGPDNWSNIRHQLNLPASTAAIRHREMIARGWIVSEDDKIHITDAGRERLREYQETGEMVRERSDQAHHQP